MDFTYKEARGTGIHMEKKVHRCKSLECMQQNFVSKFHEWNRVSTTINPSTLDTVFNYRSKSKTWCLLHLGNNNAMLVNFALNEDVPGLDRRKGKKLEESILNNITLKFKNSLREMIGKLCLMIKIWMKATGGFVIPGKISR